MADEKRRPGRPPREQGSPVQPEMTNGDLRKIDSAMGSQPEMERITAQAREVIKPVSVEVTSNAKPTRTSQPVQYSRKGTGVWLIDKKKGNKRTWMDRKMAVMMAASNPKKYEIGE